MSDGAGYENLRDKIRGQFSWKIVPVAVMTALVVYTLVGHLTELDDFADVLAGARWQWLVLSTILMGVVVVLNGWRFQLVLQAGGHNVAIRRSVAVILTVWPLVLVIPARANELLRAVALRDEVPVFSCLGSVVAERFIDVQTLCLIGMVGCAWIGAWTWFGLLALLWVVAWAVVVATVTNVDWLVKLPLVGRFDSKFRALFRGFEALRRRPRNLAAVICVSTTAWLCSMANLGFLLWIFDAPVAVAAILGLWPLAVFAGMLPVTVGGIGTRDGTFLGLLVLTSEGMIAESAVLAATFGYGLVMVVLPGVLGIPLMVRWIISESE